jgi:DNA-binding beta-propeller fold protein YncE
MANKKYIHSRKGPAQWRDLLILVLVFALGPLNGQDEDAYEVIWIAEYPGVDAGKRARFGDRVSRLVFGNKPQEVIKPFNIVALSPDRFWILDQGAGKVFEVKEGRESALRSFKKTDQVYPSLVGICRNKGGDLFVTDSRRNQVIQLSGEDVHVFGDKLSLDQPTGIAIHPKTGDIWVVETGVHRISRFDRKGRLIAELGSRGNGPGLFNFPTFIWIDKHGYIYVVDSMNYRIQIFNTEGEFLTSFGESGDASGYMARPKGVATDSKGHIYVADALFHAVQIFNSQGKFLYSFGTQGRGQGEFWMPAGLYIDEEDHIYVADSYNSRIQVFKLVNK